MSTKKISTVEEARAEYEKELKYRLDRFDIDSEVKSAIKTISEKREQFIISAMGIQIGPWETTFKKDRDTDPELFEMMKEKIHNQAKRIFEGIPGFEFEISATLKARIDSAYRGALSDALIELAREEGRKAAQRTFDSMKFDRG